jgi:hypothetical protein
MNSLAFKNLIMESHFMKLIYNPDYIAEIKEEIIEINESDPNNIYGLLIIVEKAIFDLN